MAHPITKVPEWLATICSEAVDSAFEERQREKNAPCMIFSVFGPAGESRRFNHWFSKIFKGMSVAEACAVVSTNPRILENLKDIFPNLKIRFNEPGIRESLNKLKISEDAEEQPADNYEEGMPETA